jgi:hypothetical protein
VRLMLDHAKVSQHLVGVGDVQHEAPHAARSGVIAPRLCDGVMLCDTVSVLRDAAVVLDAARGVSYPPRDAWRGGPGSGSRW